MFNIFKKSKENIRYNLSESQIKEISNYIFMNNKVKNNVLYDYIIFNGDHAVKEKMEYIVNLQKKDAINKKTIFMILPSHSYYDKSSKNVKSTEEDFRDMLKSNGFENTIQILEKKYFASVEVHKDFTKLVDLNKKNRILILVNPRVIRRRYETAKKFNLPIDKIDWVGIAEEKDNINENNWYNSNEGIEIILKELLLIEDINFIKQINLDSQMLNLCNKIKQDKNEYIKYKSKVKQLTKILQYCKRR